MGMITQTKTAHGYVKRLRRERTHLLTFLVYDIEYPNNASDLTARLIARMRKVCYGSRSERGLQSTETMATMYTTCERRRINPYNFMMAFLNDRLKEIPNPARTAYLTRQMRRKQLLHECAIAAHLHPKIPILPLPTPLIAFQTIPATLIFPPYMAAETYFIASIKIHNI